MKVLHVCTGKLFGGVETLLLTLAQHRHLCPNMEPHFACCFEGRLSQELTALGLSFHLLGNVRLSRIWQVWRSRQRLKQILHSEKFDAVVCHGGWTQVVFGAVPKSLNVPLIFAIHDTPGDFLDRSAMFFYQPELAIANSQHILASLNRLYPRVKSDYLYYPVTPSQFPNRQAVRQELRNHFNAAEKVIIIQVSRLERWKGQTLLLSALANLKHLPNWECWLVGGAQRPHEAEYLEELSNQVAASGITAKVKFLGQRSDVPSLLVAADIHCQPNIVSEPFGITFIEALYAGLPVVTTAMGGGAEIVNPSCGILVPPEAIADLTTALQTLIQDPKLRHNLGSGAPNRAKQLCDPATSLSRLSDLINQAISDNTTTSFPLKD